MLSCDDLEAVERKLYESVCGCGDTGGVSLAESADMAARISTRLLHEYRALAGEHQRIMQTLRSAVIIV